MFGLVSRSTRDTLTYRDQGRDPDLLRDRGRASIERTPHARVRQSRSARPPSIVQPRHHAHRRPGGRDAACIERPRSASRERRHAWWFEAERRARADARARCAAARHAARGTIGARERTRTFAPLRRTASARDAHASCAAAEGHPARRASDRARHQNSACRNNTHDAAVSHASAHTRDGATGTDRRAEVTCAIRAAGSADSTRAPSDTDTDRARQARSR